MLAAIVSFTYCLVEIGLLSPNIVILAAAVAECVCVCVENTLMTLLMIHGILQVH